MDVTLQQIEEKLAKIKKNLKYLAGMPISLTEEYSCQKCRDKEFIQLEDGTWTFCECRKQRDLQRRIKSSMIDPRFLDVSFSAYKRQPHNEKMYRTVTEYVRDFEVIQNQRHNGIGLLAVVGEKKLNEIAHPYRRSEEKARHNSYGLGKTHLLAALAIHLIMQGKQVLMVNDSDIVAELRQSQFDEEGMEKTIGLVENAEVLIWDDLGKAKTTDWVLNQYYRIINYRYRKQLPTCFSTNEDLDTLVDKIGDATASRLYVICKGRLVCVGVRITGSFSKGALLKKSTGRLRRIMRISLREARDMGLVIEGSRARISKKKPKSKTGRVPSVQWDAWVTPGAA